MSDGAPVRWRVECLRLRQLLKRIGLNGSRTIKISAHDGIVWWTVFADEYRWSTSTPRWRQGNVDVVAALFGKQTSQVLAETHADVVIPMPEKSEGDRAAWWVGARDSVPLLTEDEKKRIDDEIGLP